MALESQQESRSGRTSPGVTIVLIIAGLVTIAVSIIVLRGHWAQILPVWHRVLGHSVNPPVSQLLLTLAVILLYLAGCRLLFRQRAWIFLTWSVFGAVAVRLGVLALARPLDLLFACTTGSCSGGFLLGVKMSAATLHQWPALMPGLRADYPHIAISAPGWPLLYWGVSQGLERLPAISNHLSALLRPLGCDWWDFISLRDAQVAAAWLGIAAPLWAALTALPLYILGRKVADEESARAAVLLWWPLVPVAALFLASPSIIYTLPATVIVALLWSGITSRVSWRSSSQLILAGGLLGASLIVTFSMTPLLLVCCGLILCRAIQESGPRLGPVLRRLLAAALPFGIGLVAVWGAYSLWSGHSPLSLLRTAMDVHLPSGDRLSYGVGMGLNAWDFILFVGLPICGLAIASAFSKRLPGVSCLAVALGATLLALLLSGTARGEVARVWLSRAVRCAAGRNCLPAAPTRPALVTTGGASASPALFCRQFTPQHTQARPLPSYTQVALLPLQGAEVAVDATFGYALHLSGYGWNTRGKPGRWCWRPDGRRSPEQQPILFLGRARRARWPHSAGSGVAALQIQVSDQLLAAQADDRGPDRTASGRRRGGGRLVAEPQRIRHPG